MNYMTLILLSGGEKHRLLVCQEVGVSHFSITSDGFMKLHGRF
jgi:hypothetical protein